VVKSSIFRYVTGLLVALFTVGLVSSQISAADPEVRESITLSPTSVRVQLNPGESNSGELTVINDGETNYDFVVYTRPYSVADSQYTPDFTSYRSNTDAYAWVRFDKVRYHLNPGESTKVPYTVQAPVKASPGGHYGVIFVETQPAADSSGGSSISRKKRVGALLYVTVKGEYNMKGSVVGVDVSPLQFRRPLVATLSVKNEGNSDFMTAVTYRVSDVFGNVKYESQKEYPIMPDTTRTIVLEWADSPWFGVYKVAVSTSLLNQQTTQDEKIVFVAPRWLLIFVAVLVMGGVGYAILRWRKK